MRIKLLVLAFLSYSTFLFSQKEKENPFGTVLLSEKKLTHYEKDSTANAVVLYERGDNYAGLQELFKYVTQIQNNSLIKFKKNN